jgi:hypothetical protein
VLCIAAAESLTRLGLLPLPVHPSSSAWWRERWLRSKTERSADQTWYPIDVFHPVLGYTMKKNVAGVRHQDSRGVYITSSNSIGARGTREYPAQPPPGVTRVVVIGDSFAFGQGVSDDETFAAFLEAIDPGLEAINLAVHGYAHDQMLLRLRLDGLGLEPDLVVLGAVNMDVARNQLTFRDFAKPRFALRDGRLELTNTPLESPSAVRKTLRLRSLCYPIMLLDRVNRSQNASANELLTRKILDQIVSVCESAGIRAVFVYLPMFSECEQGRSRPHPVYVETCRAHKSLIFVDPTPAIHAFLSDKEQPESFFIEHYEPEIHRVIANQLQAVIADLPSAGGLGATR